jgi:hypothetical protein
MSAFKIKTLIIRNNLHVTIEKNKAQHFPRDYFYKKPIVLIEDCYVTEDNRQVLLQNLHQIVLLTILQKTENASKKYKAYLHQHQISNIRGTHSTTRFGSYVKRGGSGVIWTRKQLPGMEDFLQDIDKVGNFISSIFTKVYPAVANQVSSIDPIIRLWDTITLMFWNAITINKVHVDSRDME